MGGPGPGEIVGVVVAGGRSVRFGGDRPKQFLELEGLSVLERSIRSLTSRPAIAGVVVVLPPDWIGGKSGAEVAELPGVLTVVPGGDSRARSSRNGVEAAAAATWVLVHDAARPLASPRLVDRVVEATTTHGAAVPAVPVTDTVKVVGSGGEVVETLDRSVLRAVQTPQGSRLDWLVEALERSEGEGREVTDESAALEAAGRRVVVVDGDPNNIKITTPADLETARRLLGSSGREGDLDLRVGTGFDIHRFRDGRRLVLGGVDFPGEIGLEGHSDADVVLHAALDALLGAVGLGDIGALFPPDEPGLADVASGTLAAEVARRLRADGWSIVNLDVTVLAERPRIRDRVVDMRGAVAESLGVPAERVSIKGTTLEGLGPLGRGEGIACQAVALVSREGRRDAG